MVQLVEHTFVPGASLLWIRLLPVGKKSIIALDVNPSSSTQNNLGHSLPGRVATSILSGHSGTSARDRTRQGHAHHKGSQGGNLPV